MKVHSQVISCQRLCDRFRMVIDAEERVLECGASRFVAHSRMLADVHVEANVTTSRQSLSLWHERFGQFNKRYIERMIKNQSVQYLDRNTESRPKLDGKTVNYEPCTLSNTKSLFPLDLHHELLKWVNRLIQLRGGSCQHCSLSSEQVGQSHR